MEPPRAYARGDSPFIFLGYNEPDKEKINLFKFFYKYLIKRILFLLNPETVHSFILWLGKFLGNFYFTKKTIGLCFNFQNSKLEQNLFGLNFKNPIGLAGGFDKNGKLTQILPALGFGFMEIGSISSRSCQGNKKPRLWRLPEFKALRVHYGLPNEGAGAIAKNLQGLQFKIPLGVNIVKTNDSLTDNIEEGIKDYEKVFKTFLPIACYFTINISCPNTSGGEPFLEPENLDRLLSRLDLLKRKQAILVKLSPDLTEKRLNDLLNVIISHKVNGIICSNLIKQPKNSLLTKNIISQKGGFSGKIVENESNRLIRAAYKKTRGKLTIIGCGGVFGAKDAYKKIRLGASLIQLITGMIYEGPQIIGEINRNLVKLLNQDGYSNISQAIGTDVY